MSVITITELEARAKQLVGQVAKQEADLNALRGALQDTQQLIRFCMAKEQLPCPKCKKPNSTTRADFDAQPYIDTVWCEVCHEPFSRETWLEPPVTTPPVDEKTSEDEDPPAGAVVELPTAPRAPVASGRAKR